MLAQSEHALSEDEYTTADFRKSMSEAFASARYQEKTVHVNRHGRRWVSIVSPERAESLDRIESLGLVNVSELNQILDEAQGEIRMDDLLSALSKRRQRG